MLIIYREHELNDKNVRVCKLNLYHCHENFIITFKKEWVGAIGECWKKSLRYLPCFIHDVSILGFVSLG